MNVIPLNRKYCLLLHIRKISINSEKCSSGYRRGCTDLQVNVHFLLWAIVKCLSSPTSTCVKHGMLKNVSLHLAGGVKVLVSAVRRGMLKKKTK